jgi:hypothetical protein
MTDFEENQTIQTQIGGVFFWCQFGDKIWRKSTILEITFGNKISKKSYIQTLLD